MMKKGFLPIALMCSALVLGGLAGCVNNNQGKKDDEQTDKSVYTVAISNKDALKAEWHVKDEDRKVEVALTKDGSPVNVPAALADGSLTVSSSDATKISVIGQKIKAVEAGKATITVSYQGLQDSVELEALPVKTNKEKYGIAHEGTEADPLDNADAVKVAMYQHENANDGSTADKFYIKGIVDTFYHAPGSRTDGKVSWYMKKVGTEEKRFEIYLCEKANAVSLTDDDIWKGAEVLVLAQICYYAQGNQPETPSAEFIRVTGGAEKPQPKQTITGKTIAEILTIGKALDDGDSTWDLYVVEGFIIKKSGTNYFLADAEDASDADEKALFELYNYSNDDYNDKMTKGAKIKFTCVLKNYHGQVENGAAIEDFVFIAEGQEPDIKVTGATAVTEAAAGSYKLGLLQTTLNRNCFFTGAESGNYLATSENWADAATITLVAVEGGFNVKVGENKYLNAVVSGKYVNGKVQDSATTVYEWNAQAKSLVVKATTSEVTDEYFYLGCYGNNSTFGFSNISYLIKDGQLVAGQFPVQLYAEADLVNDATALQIDQKASMVVGTKITLAARANPYNLDRSKILWESSDTTKATVDKGVVTAKAAGEVTIKAKNGTLEDTCVVTIKAVNSEVVASPEMGHDYCAGVAVKEAIGCDLFVTGEIANYRLVTTADPTKAAKVAMVAADGVEGGFRIRVTVGTKVTWLAITVSGNNRNFSFKTNESEGSVFTLNSILKSPQINLTGHSTASNDGDYVIGTWLKSGKTDELNNNDLTTSLVSRMTQDGAPKAGQFAVQLFNASIAD